MSGQSLPRPRESGENGPSPCWALGEDWEASAKSREGRELLGLVTPDSHLSRLQSLY